MLLDLDEVFLHHLYLLTDGTFQLFALMLLPLQLQRVFVEQFCHLFLQHLLVVPLKLVNLRLMLTLHIRKLLLIVAFDFTYSHLDALP
mmetsp:Transcript_35397/g.34437  ORF Transcript_35397/g.34437 Transcript_35397/m.34437 type:complete len:88 (+) Transcript_35397:1034-1297(+)